MNEIQIFKNDDFGVIRTVMMSNEPWFVGNDVAKALGYGEGKSLPNAINNHVDKDDKGVTEMMTPGGKQRVTIINESGLYSLILSSKLPSAKKFKKWVTSEVLPTIRKTGGYMVAKKEDTPETIMARAILIAQDTMKRQKDQIDRLQADNASKDKQIVALTPDAEYTRKILTAEGTYLTNVIAKEMGMSAVTLNKKLQGIGAQYKERGIWVLTHKYQDKGYTKTTTHDFLKSNGSVGTRIQTEWTETGRRWLHKLHGENRI